MLLMQLECGNSIRNRTGPPTYVVFAGISGDTSHEMHETGHINKIKAKQQSDGISRTKSMNELSFVFFEVTRFNPQSGKSCLVHRES